MPQTPSRSKHIPRGGRCLAGICLALVLAGNAAAPGAEAGGMRSSSYDTAEAPPAGNVRNGAASAGNPGNADSPPKPEPFASGLARAMPSVPEDETGRPGGRMVDSFTAAKEQITPGRDESGGISSDNTPAVSRNQERENILYGQDGRGGADAGFHAAPPPPTRREVEEYRVKLERRLLERYNNTPEHAGNVGLVRVVLSKPLALSLDGSMIKAEFDQMVFDPWGKRIPELEEEYFVVTFASGGARLVRTDPGIRVGLDMEKAYAERMPLTADPFARVGESRAFTPPAAAEEEEVSETPMPAWWRPDFP